jgi:hypothetical protein
VGANHTFDKGLRVYRVRGILVEASIAKHIEHIPCVPWNRPGGDRPMWTASGPAWPPKSGIICSNLGFGFCQLASASYPASSLTSADRGDAPANVQLDSETTTSVCGPHVLFAQTLAFLGIESSGSMWSGYHKAGRRLYVALYSVCHAIWCKIRVLSCW